MTDNDSELLPAMLAIALAVAAQLALQDGLTLLGLAGYVVAAWLFVASVRAIFDSPAVKESTEDQPVSDEMIGAPPEAAAVATSGAGRLAFLRHHWRQVTIAEIVTGDIPPDRLADLVEAEIPGEEAAEDLPPGNGEEEGTQLAAQMATWSAADAVVSTPRAVKVTPQGDVLLLDTGAGQVQRFDPEGALLATYPLAELAGVEVLDLDVSPDGRTLYVVDAASNRLQVITLSGHES